MAQRGRRWSFTLNNYTDDDCQRLTTNASTPEVRYLIIGKEVAGTGTQHLQGYVEFTKPKRLKALKDFLGSDRAHCEISRGSGQQNRDYCTKEGNLLLEHGSMGPGQGARTDLNSVKEMLDNGEPAMAIAELDFGLYLRYRKGLEAYSAARQPPRTWKTQVVWLWGPTGTGKSRRAFDEASRLCQSVFWAVDNTCTWFDGYIGQKAVIMDDFDGTANLAFLLRLFDRYPMDVPVKGGFVAWRPRIIWVTSQYDPAHWYGDKGEHYNALARRIDEVICLTMA